jgi:hypothetical protein
MNLERYRSDRVKSMSDKPKLESGPHVDEVRPQPELDQSVQEYLGQKLRAAYNEVAEKPHYLGDPALPRELEEQLIELETRVRAHRTGTEAVREALAIPPLPENKDGSES